MKPTERLTYQKIDLPAAVRFLRAQPEAVLLDVREEEEYKTGHAAGAVALPLDEITAETVAVAIPDKETPVLLYCRTGRRSALAAEKLLRLGYRRVYDAGGFLPSRSVF